jgi:fibronectin-binding autotransporter adhesin
VLQDGVSAVADGGTVTVLPGSYSGATLAQQLALNVPTGTATIAGALGGAGALSKIGVGTLALEGMTSYSGGTTVAQGTLLVDGSIASSSVAVASGATLGGAGSIAGVISSSGILAPGEGSVGTLSAASVTLGAGNLSLDLASDAANDQLSAASFNLTGATLSLDVGTVDDGATFTIIAVAGDQGGVTGTFDNLPVSGTAITIGMQRFRIDYAGGDGNDVSLTVLPLTAPSSPAPPSSTAASPTSTARSPRASTRWSRTSSTRSARRSA